VERGASRYATQRCLVGERSERFQDREQDWDGSLRSWSRVWNGPRVVARRIVVPTGTSLFDTIPIPSTWTPPYPPTLSQSPIVALDVETNGLRWWDKDRPIGLAVTWEGGRSYYLPFGHQGGGNLDEETVKRWAREQLKNKHIVNLNTKFDIQMLKSWGVDLESQGCTTEDVSHSAALLDDSRQRFSLDRLAQDYLGQEKVGKNLDVTNMAKYHAGHVAPRAEMDVTQVMSLRALFAPLLKKEGLERVQELENKIIYVVCEMERNGTCIDTELLDKWIYESEQSYLRGLWRIYRETNLNINPSSPNDLVTLFGVLNLPVAETQDGRPSFTDAVLSSHHHPVIETLRKTRKLASLRSKYLLKYRDSVGSDGILRYALHQCRAQKGPLEGDRSAGTVTGRFSSTAIGRKEGINIQQVMSPSRQTATFGTDQFLIRLLHRPASGQWLSADAAQIEYRLFAAEARNPRVLKAYAENPRLSFHRLVWDQVKALKPDITYKQQKALNFAKLYGAGILKLALLLETITAQEMTDLRATPHPSNHPKLKSAREAMQIYSRVLPEVGPMLKRASMSAERTGYVTTLLGRRARLTSHHYKALNRKIQGSAADIMKMKLVELHNARAQTGLTLRFTVHDEVDGDCPDIGCKERVQGILDRQSADLAVPILWDVTTAPTWGECD